MRTPLEQQAYDAGKAGREFPDAWDNSFALIDAYEEGRRDAMNPFERFVSDLKEVSRRHELTKANLCT